MRIKDRIRLEAFELDKVLLQEKREAEVSRLIDCNGRISLLQKTLEYRLEVVQKKIDKLKKLESAPRRSTSARTFEIIRRRANLEDSNKLLVDITTKLMEALAPHSNATPEYKLALNAQLGREKSRNATIKKWLTHLENKELDVHKLKEHVSIVEDKPKYIPKDFEFLLKPESEHPQIDLGKVNTSIDIDWSVLK